MRPPDKYSEAQYLLPGLPRTRPLTTLWLVTTEGIATIADCRALSAS